MKWVLLVYGIMGACLVFSGARGMAPEKTSFDFGSYLPEDFKEEAQRVLSQIPLYEESLAQTASALFVSGQSYSASGKHVVNRVNFFPSKDIDLWMMRQGVVGQGFSIHQNSFPGNFLTILVDKRVTPKRAYYLQWDHLGAKPRIGGFTALCLMCHSNGPRVIRPQMAPDILSVSEKTWETIYDWNGIISDYGEIENYKPHVPSGQLPISLPGRIASEPLRFKKCVGCHDQGSSVRSPLSRQNGDSIMALIEHTGDASGNYISVGHSGEAFMPLAMPKLSTAEVKMIKDWIDGQ